MVGRGVGISEGDGVGAADGCRLGATLGSGLGSLEGRLVGAVLNGAEDGDVLGATLGSGLGSLEGRLVGAVLNGVEDGGVLGAEVGCDVGIGDGGTVVGVNEGMLVGVRVGTTVARSCCEGAAVIGLNVGTATAKIDWVSSASRSLNELLRRLVTYATTLYSPGSGTASATSPAITTVSLPVSTAYRLRVPSAWATLFDCRRTMEPSETRFIRNPTETTSGSVPEMATTVLIARGSPTRSSIGWMLTICTRRGVSTTAVGTSVGRANFPKVGLVDGANVGGATGELEGAAVVGATVGSLAGALVGVFVGVGVGAAVGPAAGSAVGSGVGPIDGFSVG